MEVPLKIRGPSISSIFFLFLKNTPPRLSSLIFPMDDLLPLFLSVFLEFQY